MNNEIISVEWTPGLYVSVSVLELLEFDSNTNINLTDFHYYLIILIGIEFGIKFSLELGTVFYH